MANMDRLFRMQKVLDDRIVKEHGLEGQNLLPKKILALQVELGELSNELPEVFKFWSNKKNNYEKALKEYVDCLHFILSIGLEKGWESYVFNFEKVGWYLWADEPKGLFGECFYAASTIYDDAFNTDWDYLIDAFLELGRTLGFTWEQIEQAYFEKNKVNHERQDGGY